MFKFVKMAGVGLSLFILGACANTKIANNESFALQAKERAATATMTPEQALMSATQKINQAQTQELNIYAPLHLRSAREALNEAQEAKNSGQPNSLILEKSFQAETLLEAAFAMKGRVKALLKPSLEHKKVLEQLNCPDTLPKDFNGVERKLQYLVKDIEGGFVEDAERGQQDLLKYMTKVEINTLKKQHLTAAEVQLEKADDIDADEFAPYTFEQAEQTLEQSELYIEQHFRNREGVKKAGLEALYAAQHAFHLAQTAEKMVAMKPDQAEQQVLAFEALLKRINTPVGIAQLESYELSKQAQLLADAIHKMQATKAYAITTTPPLTIEPEKKPDMAAKKPETPKEQADKMDKGAN